MDELSNKKRFLVNLLLVVKKNWRQANVVYTKNLPPLDKK